MSELKLYNTLTRTKETFRPIDPANVRMYVCGPTVYDFAHIGNARPVIVFDVLYRLLRHLYGAEHVTYVRNITDVDDKINARALSDHGEAIAAGTMTLNQAIARVTEKTANQFHADVKALGCLEPSFEPRATQHIPGMVAMIQQLLDKGCAYVASGEEGAEVLFDVTSMPDYGALSRRNLDEQQAGARVAVEKHKRHPADFVLWKQSGAQAPGWEATFRFEGRAVAILGRPGWHIECSVMSAAHLGETFDIHGGGIDLVFPHHENEIAQSRCTHGTPVMANYWLHNGFLQVEGKKMAKSEGNFVTIHDLLHTDKFGGRKWPGEVLRLAMLMTHYREPIDFSVRRLEEAEATIHRWAKIRKAYSDRNWVKLNSAETTPSLADPIADFLADDLNTVSAIQTMQTMARVTEAALRDGDEGNMYVGLRLLASIAWLGIDLGPETAALSGPEIEEVLIEREVNRRLALIRERNFAEADRIREDLAAQGIQLMDYKDPETGERRTKWEVKR
ncbi:MAG: cysteine--tRNA ligase [Alphaproteobacteria bacterium]|nr:MAG: cysteine--tRNA ligase [Alphaproteobacteria bacterium]